MEFPYPSELPLVSLLPLMLAQVFVQVLQAVLHLPHQDNLQAALGHL
jgi:hypothetical protein